MGSKLPVESLPASSYDVVVFSLLLSYMPTSPLRFLACIQAHRALKRDGLLVMINTRTQGGRQSNWEQLWIDAVESIGFQRVHRDLLQNLVGMSFRKVEGAKAVEQREPHECSGLACEVCDSSWASALMKSVFASQMSVASDF